MRKITAGAVLVAGAVGIAAGGIARADPVPVQTQQGSVVPARQTAELNGDRFTVDRDGDSVVVTADTATFRTVGGSVVVDDAHGTMIASLPLSYRKDGSVFPIAARYGTHTVRMTPALTGGTPAANPIAREDITRGRDVTPQAHPVAESFTPRDQQALAAFSTRAWLASFTGTVIGAIVGGVVGCAAGAVAGSVSTAITTLFAGVIPGAIIGCIAGVALVGAIGGLLGTILVAGPIGLWSAYQYFTTILSPCTAPGAYCVDPAAPAAAK